MNEKTEFLIYFLVVIVMLIAGVVALFKLHEVLT